MLSERNIIHIDDYDFGNGQKLKGRYFIILHNENGLSIILTGITTRDRIPDKFQPLIDNKRCIKHDYDFVHCYLFPKDKMIFENGFFFKKNSFIYIGQNIIEIETDHILNKYDKKIKLKDKIEIDEFFELIYCIYKSKYIKNKFTILFEKKLKVHYGN
jgi:hypothetical protein